MLDFFCIPEDQCKTTNSGRMYLYDGENDAPAVLLESPTERRPVLVENPTGLSYVFRPVDKVVYGPQDPKRGDVFFHTADKLQLYFAEVKLWHVSGWFKEGVKQLKSVVLDFIGAHPISMVRPCSDVRFSAIPTARDSPIRTRMRFVTSGEKRDLCYIQRELSG